MIYYYYFCYIWSVKSSIFNGRLVKIHFSEGSNVPLSYLLPHRLLWPQLRWPSPAPPPSPPMLIPTDSSSALPYPTLDCRRRRPPPHPCRPPPGLRRADLLRVVLRPGWAGPGPKLGAWCSVNHVLRLLLLTSMQL